jgi:hypothetical protein
VDNRRIAALTAVLYYLQEERRRQALEAQLVKPYSLINRWSMYGRQTIMQLRSRVQGRVRDARLPLPFVAGTLSRGVQSSVRLRNLVLSRNRLLSLGRRCGTR